MYVNFSFVIYANKILQYLRYSDKMKPIAVQILGVCVCVYKWLSIIFIQNCIPGGVTCVRNVCGSHGKIILINLCARLSRILQDIKCLNPEFRENVIICCFMWLNLDRLMEELSISLSLAKKKTGNCLYSNANVSPVLPLQPLDQLLVCI